MYILYIWNKNGPEIKPGDTPEDRISHEPIAESTFVLCFCLVR